MKWRQYGRNAILIEFAERPDDWAFHKSRAMSELLARKPPPQLREFVPGYTTLLLEFDLSGGDRLEGLAAEAVHALRGAARSKTVRGPLRTIAVEYSGEDLARVAEHNRISITQVIAYHTEPTYTVHLLGFSPGFPYLETLHHKLHTPRLGSPRPKVAAGSVAIGGGHTGIYTVDSPGGWNIIGQAGIRIFDLSLARPGHEEEAFYLKPGDLVRFVPA